MQTINETRQPLNVFSFYNETKQNEKGSKHISIKIFVIEDLNQGASTLLLP